MKKVLVITALIFSLAQLSFGQFKDIPVETKTKLKTGNLWFGFLNPKNLSLRHSFSAQFMSFGGNSVSLASYTATLSYKIIENLQVSADVSMQYSPFASIGTDNAVNQTFRNSLGGIYLSRVSLDYRPAKNIFININYINSPLNFNRFDEYSLWNDY